MTAMAQFWTHCCGELHRTESCCSDVSLRLLFQKTSVDLSRHSGAGCGCSITPFTPFTPCSWPAHHGEGR